jgi:hypothetical protein
MTAVCASCGPTDVKRQKRGVRCGVVVRIEGRRHVARHWLRKKYGIDWKTWHALLIAQSGRCDICRDPLVDPNVDHDHESGAVRGLLCRDCNLGLGNFRDDPDRLREAAKYLEGSLG